MRGTPRGSRAAGRRWAAAMRVWLAWAASMAWVLCVLCVLCLVAACGAAPSTVSTAANPPTVSGSRTLPLPTALAGYHIFVADILTGDVAELGGPTTHAGRSIHGVGLSTDGHTLYATDIANNAILAFPLVNGHLGAPRRAQVGLAPVHMVQTLDGGRVFVTDFGESSVSVVDAATWRTISTIHVPAHPHGIMISPDGRWIYAACVSGSAIAVIDAASGQLAGTIPLPAGANPYGVIGSRDGRYLYVPDNFAARLFVVDTTTRQVVDQTPIGLRAALIVRSAGGSTLYVTNGASNSVSVLDLADPAHPHVRATIPVGTYPHGLALTPDDRYLIVANTIGDSLTIVATANDQVIATIPGERYPNDVVVAP